MQPLWTISQGWVAEYLVMKVYDGRTMCKSAKRYAPFPPYALSPDNLQLQIVTLYPSPSPLCGPLHGQAGWPVSPFQKASRIEGGDE